MPLRHAHRACNRPVTCVRPARLGYEFDLTTPSVFPKQTCRDSRAISSLARFGRTMCLRLTPGEPTRLSFLRQLRPMNGRHLMLGAVVGASRSLGPVSWLPYPGRRTQVTAPRSPSPSSPDVARPPVHDRWRDVFSSETGKQSASSRCGACLKPIGCSPWRWHDIAWTDVLNTAGQPAWPAARMSACCLGSDTSALRADGRAWRRGQKAHQFMPSSKSTVTVNLVAAWGDLQRYLGINPAIVSSRRSQYLPTTPRASAAL